MKTKTTLAVIALMLAPSFAMAMGCSSKETTASACGEGQVYDAGAQKCVTTTS